MTQGRKRKRRNKANEELEYEKKPRVMKEELKSKQTVHLLPIKASSGKIIHKSYQKQLTKATAPEVDDDTIEKVEQNVNKPTIHSTKELIANRKTVIELKKATISHMVSQILSNPEGNVALLRKLRVMLNDTESPESLVTIQKLVIASLGYVYIDIIPGYKVRERTEKEKAVKLSKEVLARVNFESFLVDEYRLYLKALESMVKKRIKPSNSLLISAEGGKSLGEIAVHSMADLYTSTFHFNFHSNLTMAFVPIANNDKDPNVRKVCCDAIISLFAADKKGTSSLETVKVMAQVTKKQGPHRTKVEFIDTLLTLRIKVVDYSMISGRSNKIEKKKKAEERRKMSRNQRRQLKKEKDLQNELKALAATEDYDERVKTNTEIVQQIFLIYFRILKHKNGQTTDCRKILPSVLEGIAKYAHLINIMFFSDLIKVLQQLVSAGSLEARENLHCIYSVFKILSGEGDVINVDPVEFYKLVYNLPFQLMLQQNNDSNIMDIFVECIDMMLNKRRRQITLTTLCAFIKRLACFALHLHNPKDVTAVIDQMEKLLNSNSASRSLFDTESTTLGEYNAEVEEPLQSKSTSAILWDLHLLRRHYSPVVRRQASQQIRAAKK